MADSRARSTPRTKAQIEADLQAARARLTGNLESLIDEVHPSRVKQRETDKIKQRAQTELDHAKAQFVHPDGTPRADRLAVVGGAVAGFVTFVLVLRAIGRSARTRRAAKAARR